MRKSSRTLALVLVVAGSLGGHGCAESEASPTPGPGTNDGGNIAPDSTTGGDGGGDSGPTGPTEPSISVVQLAPGLWEISIDEGSFELEDGAEGTWCMRLPIPAELRDKELALVGSDWDLPIGTHHFFMAYSRNERSGIEPCVPEVGGLLPLSGEAISVGDPGIYLAGFGRGAGSSDLPEGFGSYISPNGHFVTNHHVLNITGGKLDMHGRFKFRVKEKSGVRRIMRTLNCLNEGIYIGPGETVDVTATCITPMDIEVVQLGSHAHQHLDRIDVRVFRGGELHTDVHAGEATYPATFDVTKEDGSTVTLPSEVLMLAWRYPVIDIFGPKTVAQIAAQQAGDWDGFFTPNDAFWEYWTPVLGGEVLPEIIYTSTEWDAPAGIDRHSNPIALQRGDGLTYTCRYTNPKSVPVLYGVHEDEEMCATMNLYVLPDTPENASVVPPSLANIVNWEPGFKDTIQDNTKNVLVDTDDIRKVYPGDFAF